MGNALVGFNLYTFRWQTVIWPVDGSFKTGKRVLRKAQKHFAHVSGGLLSPGLLLLQHGQQKRKGRPHK